MYRKGIAKIQHIQICRLILFHPSVSEIHLNDCVFSTAGNTTDIPDIAVVYIIMILDLHDLVPTAEHPFAAYNLRLSRTSWVYQFPQPFIQGVGAGFRFLAVRRKQSHIVNAISFGFLQIKLCYLISRHLHIG